LVVFTGLQASGKSAFYRERFAATHEHVSKDSFRNNKNPERRQRQLIREALGAGRSVVVDNTNPTAEDRRSLVELGHELGARIVGYYFEAEARECVERNRERRGKARVPNVAIYATAKKLVSPSRSEGFDELFRVRIAADEDGFRIGSFSGDAEG
jgi:predicted kinase